jgi:hypothetical protein
MEPEQPAAKIAAATQDVPVLRTVLLFLPLLP